MRIEAFEDDSEAEVSGEEFDIRELRARKQALARKVAEQQRRQDKIQVGHLDLRWEGRIQLFSLLCPGAGSYWGVSQKPELSFQVTWGPVLLQRE